MRPILSPGNRSVLQQAAAAKVLLAFDFDGTLSPIVSDPAKASLRPATRALLRRLTSLYPCIVVSGRSRSDVRRKLRGIHFKEFIGNHGIEPWDSSRAVMRLVKTWIPVLKSGLSGLQGVELENKRFSVSIHFRRARHKKKTLAAITALARTLPAARLAGGKMVVNVVPDGAPDKGIAVERSRKKYGYDRVIYLGDDVTDEDVFALSRNGRFLGVRVGASDSSFAPFYIPSQKDTDRLLAALIQLRSHPC